ncbi:PEP-CTERM sorting domain-containing protein [Massilia sp. IC2-477]|uniref:PEP-CTERM sorting domain-containing protein n=1 Tax=Massilia sp. IC2-477 TaxID=2887198 RepID=UPI001D126861|nr:PEP-CTERM sorting domain-containing protein [Massilia sp. IC2-477]MCC2954037.1 PEP-CTERM sorting domain-containing protein [Massilia sp. IC2-477]
MKKLLSTGALLLCCTAAHADPTESISWGFSFNGFYDSVSDSFLPDEIISGSFKGNDLDSDGVLEKGELLSLVVGELDYIACASTSNDYYQCGASSFAFSPDAGLHFSVGSYGQDPEGWVGGGRLITTGDQHYAYDFNPNMTTERHLYWTSDTRLSMMSQAPEPHTWAMLAAGLLGLTWRVRSQARRA